MTREHAKELLPIITGFANGEEIQFKFKDNPKDTWSSAAWPTFDASQYDYRIKPKPREWEIFAHDHYGITVKGTAIPAIGETIRVREILD